MKKTKFLKSIFVFSILILPFVLSGCVTVKREYDYKNHKDLELFPVGIYYEDDETEKTKKEKEEKPKKEKVEKPKKEKTPKTKKSKNTKTTDTTNGTPTDTETITAIDSNISENDEIIKSDNLPEDDTQNDNFPEIDDIVETNVITEFAEDDNVTDEDNVIEISVQEEGDVEIPTEGDADVLPEIDEPEIFDAELTEEPSEDQITEPDTEVKDIPHSQDEKGNEKQKSDGEDLTVEITIKDDEKVGITVSGDNKIGITVTSDDKTETENKIENIVAQTEDDVVDITDEEENPEDEEVSEIEIIPSRSVSLRVGEYLELDYPGKGWIYMGAIDGSKNLTSAGRKLGDKDTNFTLLARNEGTSVLHFFKEDVLAGVYIDDYIEVTVEPTKSSSKTRVKAPSYAETVPKQPETKKSTSTTATTQTTTSTKTSSASKSTDSQTTQTVTEQKTEQTAQKETTQSKTTTTSTSETAQTVPPAKTETPPASKEPELSADELLKSAKTKFDAKNYEGAKNDLELFLTVAESDRDEALYLLGQVYESNSKAKDIKKAIETYEKLMSNYPTSKYWDDANKRAIYLKRFYINIR